jgi:hypothetical protein
MKNLLRSALLLLLIGSTLLFAAPLQVQPVTFSGGTWGSSSTALQSTNGYFTATSGPSSVYAGGMMVVNTYVFGFTNVVPTGPLSTSSYDVSSVLPGGTSLTLNFSVTNTPKYIAYTGGLLTGYSYNSTSKVLSLTASTVDPVASASDPLGTTLSSVFALKIETGGTTDYAGSVFRTDMFFKDLSTMDPTFSGSSPLTGLQACGVDGVTATFDAYLPGTHLASLGFNSPYSNVGAVVQKSSVSYEVPATLTNVTSSTFDFDGGGSDQYLFAEYANTSWSVANIGITAVPEPADYAALIGVLAMGGVVLSRRFRR